MSRLFFRRVSGHGCVAGFVILILAFSNPAYVQERRVVRIVAERFSFTPSQITVPIGTTLGLRVRSEDTAHGFRIVGGDVNVAVPKRRQGEAVVVFEATEVGRYRFECSRLCGAGHNFMRGAIIVVGE